MKLSKFHILILAVVSVVLLSTATAILAREGGPKGSSSPSSQTNLLGCQKNNPDRLDCSSLEVTGVCEADTAVFTITNTGEAGNGDMLAATQYRLVVDGEVVETGEVLLSGGETMQVSYSGGGTVTLEADQQIGHPGSSHPRVTLNCAPPTDVPTEVPTEEPTEEPTETPTEEPTQEPTPDPANIWADGYCIDGRIVFIIGNSGGDMTDSLPYIVHDASGYYLTSDYFQLVSGADFSLEYSGYDTLMLIVGDGLIVITPVCEPQPTEEPTEPPTEPVITALNMCGENGITFSITNYGSDMTESMYYIVHDSSNFVVGDNWFQLAAGETLWLEFPGYDWLTLTVGDGLIVLTSDCGQPTEPPVITADAYCADGNIVFFITNSGGDVTEPMHYAVVDDNGSIVSDNWFQLAAGETTVFDFSSYASLTLYVGDDVATASAQCEQQPTEEPTPVPTEEPTPVPTEEPTEVPTEEPTAAPTEPTAPPDDSLGCQKNNPDRLDCSSLQVSGTCDGGIAVFTITNTGEAGNGDMRAPTQYRLIVDGVVVETGTVQISGGTSMQVSYSGGGTVTLEADQQVGHPGGSQPQATLTCS